jgi:hypothetical protein
MPRNQLQFVMPYPHASEIRNDLQRPQKVSPAEVDALFGDCRAARKGKLSSVPALCGTGRQCEWPMNKR